MSSLFDPPPPPSDREQLLAERHRLLGEYSESGGDRRDEIDRRLIAIAARLHDLQPARPASTAAPPSRRRHVRATRDGRMAATGERD